MVHEVRNASWSYRARLVACVAIAVSCVLCAGAAAAAPQAGSRPSLSSQIARHLRANARHQREAARHDAGRSRKVSDAPADQASLVPFRRGDVFMLGVRRHLRVRAGRTSVPNFGLDVGQLRQVIPATDAITECFDPSGRYLVAPGAGLFNNVGEPLPSQWATVTNAARCVVDGSGHVYVSTGLGPNLGSGPWTVTKYDIAGNFLQTMDISVTGFGPLAIDLAPDDCARRTTPDGT